VRELPEIALHSLYTHEGSTVTWEFAVPAEINPVSFGRGETVYDQRKPTRTISEWRKGGRIIRWMKQHDVRAAVVFGYNDSGRMRILRWCHRHGVACFVFGDSNIKADTARGVKGWLKRRVVGKVVRWCTGVMPCGTLGQAFFERYGARPEQVFFLPYEPDYELASSVSADVLEATRERFKLNAGRRRIVYSGRLEPFKRVDLLVDAFAAIADERPDWDLVIVGDGSERESLKARLPAALSDRVTWTGFIDDQKVVTSIYRLSDVLVLPSDFEPWAVVINEAAAAGLAIVASDVVGAAAELVREGVNGHVFPAGDLGRLKAALLDVTAGDRADAMKAASAAVLADWRRRGDPVAGLRRALEYAGVLLADKPG
jgi:glycosyltransferase involved in cell wall biosynthesis